MNRFMKDTIKKLTLSAMFLALSYVLPFFTGQIPEIGAMLCPMHIPVLLCGFFCGVPWGFAVGLIAPLLRSFTLGMPPMFPTAICMAVELAAYGGISGLLYKILPKKKIYVYVSLMIAMIAGRIVWGLAMLICMGINGSAFGLRVFWTSTVVNSIPGIIIQIILIPLLVISIRRIRVEE